MKTKSRIIVLAVSCFVAGFFTCLVVVRWPQPTLRSTPQEARAVLLLDQARLAALNIPATPAPPRLRDGTPFQHPDRPLRVESGAGPDTPQQRTGYYDLIDPRDSGR